MSLAKDTIYNIDWWMRTFGLSGWFSIICGGTDFNFHHHNISNALVSFAVMGVLSIPRVLKYDVLKNQPKEIRVEVSEHKPCCDCDDEELHEEALKEIEEFLKR